MGEVKVLIDDQALRDLFSDSDGPVGRAVADATSQLADEARLLAPVSKTGGSKLAPSGYLKANTREALTQHHDPDTGHVQGLVGAIRYPFNFIANPTSHKGFTRNRGGKSVRRADDDYLERAVDSLPFQTYGVWQP